ncbi:MULTISPECIES: toll/interleukin-1 receptor domain-containing protein [unclassified Bradyrhizobium]|uniref:toll/interleukin-1 receptor domain-containing protein n=1 Tax=unclassified Bradyrhizobium TaxID=2631580 RepID=UPI001FFBA6E9|nr:MULTISPECIES: toll/interleukin-1 receptor domain-containing protein [unclassified Bradyrhizobium]MCK1707724.1 toll/interleukin-1 receptor domain-containing protein [Bradyrhizobium sp. 143]MCK1730025.1 toll/interleukin-1 receptor domain-containing protein [Bradyrhizobium sp. 142]
MSGIKVFLSHKNEDSEVAGAIAYRLKIHHQIDVYLDVIDRNMEKNGPDLADYIRAEMEKCTQLLAVISAKTRESQWVPWEIGVATEKERPLASFINPPATIPEFLRKWPYLQSQEDVDRYASVSKSTRLVQEESVRRATASASSARRTAFREFHRSLKAQLGQR